MSETVAWLHTMHMEGGQKRFRVELTALNPFGKPGKDYSAAYTVTSEPLCRDAEVARLRRWLAWAAGLSSTYVHDRIQSEALEGNGEAVPKGGGDD